MPVAVYLRVSTEEQRERQSILTQLEFAERYCRLYDLPIFRIYSDDGVSGTVPVNRRPEASQILRDAGLRKFDQLLVYRLDRLGRETKLILNAVDELEKLGVRVKSLTEDFDTSTSTGRLMLTMLSGFASHERDVIRERSVAGTQRVAEAGAWLGGIVPYGYRKVGEKRDARLVVSDDPIPGLALSEADVIKEVFRLAAVERSSCRAIAEKLNAMKVPCAYSRDSRMILRGKRKQATSGTWGPGRIRALITNPTYRGVHEYGKRSKSRRPVVRRTVPALVSEEIWNRAQETLRANFLFSKRSAKTEYLLRGLIKCAICGHSYIGMATQRPSGKREFYYRCNAAHTPRLTANGQRCPAKAVRGDVLEQQIWEDVESFLRNPGEVLEQLHRKLREQTAGSESEADQIDVLQAQLEQKAVERSRVLGLFRRGLLRDVDLEAQLGEIKEEERQLEESIARAQGQRLPVVDTTDILRSAEALLAELRKRLDEPVSSEVKRRLIEVLVSGIRIETVEGETGRHARAIASYRFLPTESGFQFTVDRSASRTGDDHAAAPQTVGEHLRRKRMVARLTQRELADRIGVTEATVFNWEANRTAPHGQHMPAVIEFLGYEPVYAPTGRRN